jgi:hypothetical protein
MGAAAARGADLTQHLLAFARRQPQHRAGVSSSRPPGSRSGSSKVRAQPTADLDRAISYYLQGCAERSIGVLFRCLDCRTFWADCSAFLSRPRSSFNSEI